VEIVKVEQLIKVYRNKFLTRALEEKVMEYNYLLPMKKERRERRREACLSVSFLPYRKTLYIVA